MLSTDIEYLKKNKKKLKAFQNIVAIFKVNTSFFCLYILYIYIYIYIYIWLLEFVVIIY